MVMASPMIAILTMACIARVEPYSVMRTVVQKINVNLSQMRGLPLEQAETRDARPYEQSTEAFQLTVDKTSKMPALEM